MSPTRIYLHIGSPKTGTTALQYYLYDHRDALSEKGYLYPTGLNLTMGKAQHPIYFALAGMRWHPDFYYDITGERLAPSSYREEYHLEDCMRELRYAAANADRLIVSSEGFFVLDENAVRSLCAALAPYDVTVLVYLRRQDQFAEAMYRHYIFDSWTRYRLPMEQCFSSWYIEHCHYLRKLDLWAECFGQDRIRVIPYERSSLSGGDVVLDFLGRIGVPADGLPAPGRVNGSQPNDTIRMLSAANATCWERREDAADFSKFLREGPESDGKVSSMVRRSQAIEFLDQFEAENREVARKYLAAADGRLFAEEHPAPSDGAVASGDDADREKAAAVLKRAVELLLGTPSVEAAEIMLAATAIFKAARNGLGREVATQAAMRWQLERHEASASQDCSATEKQTIPLTSSLRARVKQLLRYPKKAV